MLQNGSTRSLPELENWSFTCPSGHEKENEKEKDTDRQTDTDKEYTQLELLCGTVKWELERDFNLKLILSIVTLITATKNP